MNGYGWVGRKTHIKKWMDMNKYVWKVIVGEWNDVKKKTFF